MMRRSFAKSESALIEIGLMFLPGIPAYFWLWTHVTDTIWEKPANAFVYMYFIAGTLFIGLRRWSWNEIGINRNGIGFSLACGGVLIVARMLALAGTNIPLAWQLDTFDRLLGESFFYLALVGVGEELIFRGVAYRALEEWRGTRWAIWLTTLGFGIWHIGGRGIAGIAVGIIYGIFFAAIRWRAGGIIGLIIAHALIDLSTVAIVPNIEMNYLLTHVQVVHSWLALLSEITFLGLLIFLWKAPFKKHAGGTA
jgi:membrane protease YdiL (CAAX protease family)